MKRPFVITNTVNKNNNYKNKVNNIFSGGVVMLQGMGTGYSDSVHTCTLYVSSRNVITGILITGNKIEHADNLISGCWIEPCIVVKLRV